MKTMYYMILIGLICLSLLATFVGKISQSFKKERIENIGIVKEKLPALKITYIYQNKLIDTIQVYQEEYDQIHVGEYIDFNRYY